MITHLFASLPVLLFFVLGFLLKRISFFKRKTIEDIKKFILNFSVPALLFRAFLSLSIQPRYLLLIGVVFIMAGSMVLIGKVVAHFGKIRTPYFPLLMSGFEMSMFGYALFISLYGIENLGYLAFLSLGQTVFTFTFLISMLLVLREGKQSPRAAIKRFFSSPIILAIAAGLLVGRIAPPFDSNSTLAMIDEFLSLVGSVTVPLITITIGYDIVIEKKGLGLSMVTILTRKTFLLIFALLMKGINTPGQALALGGVASYFAPWARYVPYVPCTRSAMEEYLRFLHSFGNGSMGWLRCSHFVWK